MSKLDSIDDASKENKLRQASVTEKNDTEGSLIKENLVAKELEKMENWRSKCTLADL